MKRTLIFLSFFIFLISPALAQKTVYIPDEWRQNRTDTLLYAESDPDNKYTWSKSRSIEGDNVIIFWDKYYTTAPHKLSRNDFYYVDIPDLLAKCESFFDLEINQLGFVDPQHSNLNKYKVMVLMNHTTEWTCYGGGYDFEVSALWLNPSTCKPVGFAVAHEVGHSFHYMCFAEACGHNHWGSQTDNTGFHLANGSGQAIWEQTAQWQAAQSFPNLMFNESYPIFRYTHNYAFSHEWHRYQSYWFHYFINQYYDDIQTVAKVWNQPMKNQTSGTASDFNQALMALKGLSVRDLFKLYFDYACRCATWDLDATAPYRQAFIGDFEYRCVLVDDETNTQQPTAGGDLQSPTYQVAMASCPQGTGFNVIPLQIPAAGTEIKTTLTGLIVGAPLLDADPGEFYNGDSQYEKSSLRRYINGGPRASRGFRMGYVALMQDGSRRYFSEDSVYCQGALQATADYTMTLPEGVSQLWLVISPALKTYVTHRWDDKIDKDDMWPYRFSLQGTDISTSATVYVKPTLDGRPIGDCTFTYDVQFPRDTQGYSGATVSIGGKALATLGTAFQLDPSTISTKLQAWSSQGPANGRIMFYALKPDGTLASSGSTANGYGHWFDTSGNVCAYSAGYVYSEYYPTMNTFTLGQYPGKCAEGKSYTIRQALRYRKNPKEYAQANFIFNITVGGTAATATLQSIEYKDTRPITGDVNGDGTVDVADIAAVIDVMAGTPLPSGGAGGGSADVNQDGTVDVADIAAIIDIMAGTLN